MYYINYVIIWGLQKLILSFDMELKGGDMEKSLLNFLDKIFSLSNVKTSFLKFLEFIKVVK